MRFSIPGSHEEVIDNPKNVTSCQVYSRQMKCLHMHAAQDIALDKILALTWTLYSEKATKRLLDLGFICFVSGRCARDYHSIFRKQNNLFINVSIKIKEISL